MQSTTELNITKKVLFPDLYRPVTWQHENMSKYRMNTSLRNVVPTLRDKILTIRIMRLLGPGYNTTFVDRVERCLHGLRLCARDRVFEGEELFDFVVWDMQETKWKKSPKILKMWHKFIEDTDDDKTVVNNLCDNMPCRFCRVL